MNVIVVKCYFVDQFIELFVRCKIFFKLNGLLKEKTEA